MIKFGNYILFESEEDFLSNVYCTDDSGYVFDGGILVDKPSHYPIVLSYTPNPFATGCCGRWRDEYDETNMIAEIEEELSYLSNLIQAIKTKIKEKILKKPLDN